MTLTKNTIKDAARLSIAKWYNKGEEAGVHSFNVIAQHFMNIMMIFKILDHQMQLLNHSMLR